MGFALLPVILFTAIFGVVGGVSHRLCLAVGPWAIHPTICGPPKGPLVRGIPWPTTILKRKVINPKTSPLLAAGAMPALGAMPGA